MMYNLNELNLTDLSQNEMLTTDGGGFAYDVGTAIRFVCSVFAGPAAMAAYDINQAALEVINKN